MSVQNNEHEQCCVAVQNYYCLALFHLIQAQQSSVFNIVDNYEERGQYNIDLSCQELYLRVKFKGLLLQVDRISNFLTRMIFL